MLVDAVRRFFAERAIAPSPIVAAVSGGADSTALLLALAELRVDVSAAHVNHHLRGAESDADERFVRDLCTRLGIALDVADGALDPAAVKRAGVEAAAREIRTRLLLEIKERRGARFVATAHQKNDQAETVLMRLFTGSGLAGLRGIHPVREDGFIRPMLDVTRHDVEDFLRRRGITPRVDSTNADPRFLRNRIRAALREHGPAVIESLAEVAKHATTMWESIERDVDVVAVETTDDETRFAKLPDDPVIRHALLLRHIRRLDPHARDISYDFDGAKRVSITKSLELLRRGDGVTLRKKPRPIDEYEFEIAAGQEIFIPQAGVTFRVARDGGGQPFQLPKDATPNFTIRNRRNGDRFRPLGLGHEKKLKDLLIDRKIPIEQRDRIPLLIWNGEIVWVAGVEISDAFKITGDDGDRYVVQSSSSL